MLSDQYRRWFEYEKDSHAKVLASLRAVPAEQRSSPGFQKAVDLMAHIVAARRLWLFRFGVAPEGPRELFPQGVPLEGITHRLSDMETAWNGYLEPLDDAELAREFTYRSLEGEWFRNTIQDILTQLFGHSWYHRGQIRYWCDHSAASLPLRIWCFGPESPCPAERPRDRQEPPGHRQAGNRQNHPDPALKRL